MKKTLAHQIDSTTKCFYRTAALSATQSAPVSSAAGAHTETTRTPHMVGYYITLDPRVANAGQLFLFQFHLRERNEMNQRPSS